MQTRTATAVLTLILTLCIPAQRVRAEDAAVEQPAEKESAEARFERLVRAALAAELEAGKAYRAGIEKEKAAAEAENRDPVWVVPYDMTAPIKPHVEHFVQAATDYAGTDDAVRYLTWLASNARWHESGKAAIETLIARHLESAELTRFAAALPYYENELGAERMRTTLSAVIEKNPNGDVRAAALIARGESARETDADAARADLVRAAEVAEDRRVAARARGILTEMDELQIGMVAPDIEGRDLDGTEFKLSDYRGKVVVLDFWGDW